MKLYMVVTADEYELPIMVGDSAQYIAQRMGISANRVCGNIWRCENQPDHFSGKKKGYKYLRIDVDEDGEEE